MASMAVVSSWGLDFCGGGGRGRHRCGGGDGDSINPNYPREGGGMKKGEAEEKLAPS
jgi:hypothetical protein